MFRTRRVFEAVTCSACKRPLRPFSDSAERSPTKWMRTPSFCSCGTSRANAAASSSIRPETSSAGRFQFSEEKANTVSTFTPTSPQWRTQARSASTPFLCPATRGRKRLVAQRPLPSMTTAMWCGTARGFLLLMRTWRSDLHDLLFLGGHERIDLVDVLVGRLLHVGLRTLVV